MARPVVGPVRQIRDGSDVWCRGIRSVRWDSGDGPVQRLAHELRESGRGGTGRLLRPVMGVRPPGRPAPETPVPTPGLGIFLLRPNARTAATTATVWRCVRGQLRPVPRNIQPQMTVGGMKIMKLCGINCVCFRLGMLHCVIPCNWVTW